ncbi:uncharacterized protein [Antedon mediterranea]|uniref:uncharacterized protein n=1 Tax=Antedon mediterranea TaxID=105859 RepID=UPI003AF569B0
MEPNIINLRDVDFHANWNLENTCKSFKSLKQSIIEHREDTKSFTIELLLFESYTYMSDFKGNDEKDISKAKEINEEAFRAISELPDRIPESIKNGYKSMYLALKCWFANKRSNKEEHLKELSNLLTVYKHSGEEDKRKFEASIHATKGFALSRLKFSRYEESATELKLASEICPENVEWKFMFGLIAWRIPKRKLYPSQWSDELNRAEEIMDEVLKLDAGHAYAKTILADIYRRKYHQGFNQKRSYSEVEDVDHSLVFENVENLLIFKILNLLEEAKKSSLRPRILSLIAQCYIRMGECKCKRVKTKCSEPKCDSIYYKKAHDVIECAKEKYGKAACIFVQEAILYREKNETNKQLECLENAIRLQPSDPAAKMQKAKALASLGKHDDVDVVYDNLLSDFKDDPIVLFDVNQNYARYLALKEDYRDAVCSNQACIDIALESFAKTTSGNRPVEFLDEYKTAVNKIVKYVRNHFNSKIKHSEGLDKIAANLENAKLHEKLGDFKNACSYYKEGLKAYHYAHAPNTSHAEEIETLVKFARVNLKMSSFDVCSNILAIIKCETCVKEKDVRQLTMDLFVAKGEKEAASGDGIKAIRIFTRATELRSLVGAKRLLEETKRTEDTKLRMSALKSIASVAKGSESWSKEFNLKQELAELLPSCDDGSLMGQELKALRGCQLEMEYSILMDDDKIATNISIVLQQGRNILNHAMEQFGNKHYPNSKARSVDFIIIPKVTPPETVDQRIQKILKQRDWKDFRNKFKPLLIYLVSIQPATNAKFEWLQAVNTLNNDDKHRRLQENSSKTISVARDMCSNIEEILEEIYKWCWITEKEP